jgi:hypothetical protein
VQETIVALIVLAAFAWAAWYWMPAAWRRAVARAMGRGGRRVGLQDGGARRIEQALGKAPGCSSCDSCGSCATPGKPPAGTLEPGVHSVKLYPNR